MVVGAVLSYLDKTGSAVATYAASICCLIFVHLPQFKKFKGFGIEAELKQKIEEANETLERLREITVPIAHMLFTMVAKMGRWSSSIPRRQQYEITKKIENELKSNGVKPVHLEKAKGDWHHYNIIDLARPIMEGTLKDVDEGVARKRKKVDSFKGTITAEIRREYDMAINEWRKASSNRKKLQDLYKLTDQQALPDEIEDYIKSSTLIDENKKHELLDRYKEEFADLRYYIKHHEFRRLEKWFADCPVTGDN